MEKWSMDQGNLMSETARTHRLGLYLRSKDRHLFRIIANKSVITNSKQVNPTESADSFKDDYLESERCDLMEEMVRSSMLQIRRLELCWTDKEQSIAECHAEFKKHDFQADHDYIVVGQV